MRANTLTTDRLLYFSSGQLYFYRAPSSISDYLILPTTASVRGSHGLSARRARRTKSRMPEGQKAGPKGRQLEVGAQRAPRLLVCYIFEKVMVRGPQKQCSWVSDLQIHKYANRPGNSVYLSLIHI